MSRSLFVIAGEKSGDTHAAELLRVLTKRHPDLRVGGAGGAETRAVAGDAVRDWLDQAAVMGVVEVLKHYRFFKRSFEELLEEARTMRPDVLLLVDYPGFNFRFAEAVRRELPDTKIVQYVCPQVWAWKKGRIPKMAELFDEVLCLLPFEPEIFENTALRATFAGHPLVDELEASRLEVARESDLVALIPGSREREVAKLFPMMLDTVGRLRMRHPELRFEVPAANAALRERLRAMVEKEELGAVVRVLDGGAHALMQRAACGVVTSGTATLEAAWHGLPYCLVYKLAWPTYLIARAVVKIDRIGLINILAKEEVVEEFVQSDADPCHVAESLNRFLKQPEEARALQARLAEVVGQLGGPGAHERAADAVDRWLDSARG